MQRTFEQRGPAPEPPLGRRSEPRERARGRAGGTRRRRRGYAVDVAQNGWQAFAQMQTRLYDFVFLDIEMPVMNGYRCAQAIRKWEARVEREQKQFICALTSHSKPSERELGMGIGMNLFEAKPAKPKRLLGIVERALAAANGDAAGHGAGT